MLLPGNFLNVDSNGKRAILRSEVGFEFVGSSLPVLAPRGETKRLTINAADKPGLVVVGLRQKEYNRNSYFGFFLLVTYRNGKLFIDLQKLSRPPRDISINNGHLQTTVMTQIITTDEYEAWLHHYLYIGNKDTLCQYAMNEISQAQLLDYAGKDPITVKFDKICRMREEEEKARRIATNKLADIEVDKINLGSEIRRLKNMVTQYQSSASRLESSRFFRLFFRKHKFPSEEMI